MLLEHDRSSCDCIHTRQSIRDAFDCVAVTALGMLVRLLLAAAARGRQHVHWLSMQPVKMHEGQSAMNGSRLEISQGMLGIWTNNYFRFKPDRMCEMRPLREIHL
jgi:hypothetical protein